MRGLVAFGAVAALAAIAACSSFGGTPADAPDGGVAPAEAGAVDSGGAGDGGAVQLEAGGDGNALVNQMPAQGNSTTLAITVAPLPTEGNLLVLAIATPYRAAPSPVPKINASNFEPVEFSGANVGLSVWSHVVQQGDSVISGLVPDTAGYVAMVTEWRAGSIHAHATDSGGTGKVVPGGIDARSKSVILGFASAAAVSDVGTPLTPYQAIGTGAAKPGTLSIFGSYTVTSIATTGAPQWSLPEPTVGWDTVTLSFPLP